MNVTVIGVAGGTGSGKSTLVKRLQEAFVGDDVVTLCHDYYYKAHPELTYEERTKLNYDHPQAFDTEMLVEHIKALKNNVPIEHPVYSFVDHDRTSESVSVKPSKVIIVDGILIFENKELRDPDGHQGLRRHRRRHPAGAAYPARRLRARTHDAVGHHAVHLDGEADA